MADKIWITPEILEDLERGDIEEQNKRSRRAMLADKISRGIAEEGMEFDPDFDSPPEVSQTDERN